MNKQRSYKGYMLAGILIVLAVVFIISTVKLQQQGQVLNNSDMEASGSLVGKPGLGEAPGQVSEQDEISLEKGQNQPQEGESESPYLLDHLPFQEEDVKSVFVIRGGEKREIPYERLYVVMQSLRFTDMQAAVTEPAEPAGRVVIQFILDDEQLMDIPYNLENNAFEAAGKAYYADDQVLLLMHGLLKPESELGQFDALEERARLEAEGQADSSEPAGIEREQIAVDGQIYIDWEKRLAAETSDWKMPYYDYAIGEVREIRKFKEGILELNNKIVFSGISHETSGGVKVGLTAAEVSKKLDADARKLPSKWSYKSGDYFRFHLYFEGSEVKYMVLSQPL